MLENANLFSLAREKVKQIFSENPRDELTFHNYEQTEENARIAKELAFDEDCTEDETETILFSVWFLFTGYTKDLKEPLPKSAELARDFLEEKFPGQLNI